jgi:LysR family nitrogen assimilation transcriptional regulator
MDTATLALALAVMQEGSVRGAARLLGRAPSSVADAFERFEIELAMKLASRKDGALSLTLAGESMACSGPAFCEILAGMARLSGASAEAASDILIWTSRNAMPVMALQNFNGVVRSGSIRRAARARGIGQPNLSRQMAQLEKIIGKPLLVRHIQGCEPTAEGMEFSEAALALTAKLASLTGPAKKRFAQEIRTVKLGTIIPVGHESRLAARLAALVAAWQSDESRQNLFVSSTTAEDLVDGLRSGRFDVALTDIAIRHKRFESQQLFSSELVLIGASDVVKPDSNVQALISSHRIAVPSLRSGLRQKVSEALEPFIGSDGRAARLVEVDALSIIINLVLDHGYLTVLPLDAVAALDREIGIARLPGAPQVGFHLVWQRTPAAGRIAGQIAGSLTSA